MNSMEPRTGFPGLVRRGTKADLYPISRIAAVCFEYEWDDNLEGEAFVAARMEAAKTSLNVNRVHWPDKYVAELDGTVIGGMAALPYEIHFDGQKASMCGISGVCTLPQHRRLGAIRAMMEQMLRDEYEKGTEFSFLYPFSGAFYSKFGYGLFAPYQQWTLALRDVLPRKESGSFELYDGDESHAAPFYEAYDHVRLNGMVVRRSRCDYKNLLEANPFKTNSFAYLYRDTDGMPRGYMIFSKKSENKLNLMEVEEFIYDDEDTAHALLAFAAQTFGSNYEQVRFTAADTHDFLYVLKDFHRDAVARKLQSYGMIRVIHIEKAMQKARFLGSGEAVLNIMDASLGRNLNLAVRYKDGALADLSETCRQPDARMDIDEFSSGLMGAFADFRWRPRVEVHNPEALRGIFYRKDLWIENFF